MITAGSSAAIGDAAYYFVNYHNFHLPSTHTLHFNHMSILFFSDIGDSNALSFYLVYNLAKYMGTNNFQ